MDFDVQNHLRSRALRSADHFRVGPFVVNHNPERSNPFFNYAIPDDRATPSAEDVADLVEAFRARDRVPRLEYLPVCSPEVEPALLAAGFAAENRAAVMVCSADTLLPPLPVDGVRLREPREDAEFLAVAGVQHLGYGGSGPPDPGSAARLRSTADSGGVVVLATTDDGTPAGGGICTPPSDGLTELAGLAVDAGHRRRGIGAAVSARLTDSALARGCRLVWLEPGEPAIGRMYARIGYRTVGEKLNIRLRQNG